MSLRTKWALGLGGIVAVVILVAGVAANTFIANELRGETDAFLTERSDAVGRLVTDRGGRRALGPRTGPPLRLPGGDFTQFDAVTQAVGSQGRVIFTEGGVELPVGDVDLAVAAGTIERSLRTVVVGEADYRVLTTPLVDNVALQLGRDVTENEQVLSGVRRRLLLSGLLGAAGAALIGWVAAGRAIRPVRRVTAAAEDVARTQDLSEPLPVEGTDEVARLATSFNTMMAALRRSKDQQKRLVMDASHELRTPLTSLRTSIEVLERGIPDDEVRTRLLANASSELRELTALVAELVDLATDQSPETAPRSEVDLVVAAERAAHFGRQRHGRIIDVVADGPDVVDAVADGVDRALNNLVDNAAKFSPADTPIEIRVHGTTVEVRDHGPGIDEADMAHVFDRFYRAETARTLTGSGLGLAIVAQVAADHDGETSARNEPDGGAVVGFSLGRSARL